MRTKSCRAIGDTDTADQFTGHYAVASAGRLARPICSLAFRPEAGNRKENMRKQIGDTVTFIDDKRKEHNALVTAVWSDTCINIVLVSDDESKTDQYGRQLERHTSVSHASLQTGEGAPFGMCWK